MRNKNYKPGNNNCVSLLLVVVLLVAVGIVSLPEIARADPHAVFYTTTGQLQLFYNVLAALDQVDWSETKYMRERLLEQRAIADYSGVDPPFDDEQWPLTDATKLARDFTATASKPGPVDVITRAITLEGTDLYSDQLVRMFGAEHGRRNSTSELVRALCDYGLGLKDCEFDTAGKEPEEIAEMVDYRNQAVVSDIWRWLSLPFTSGIEAAFESGRPAGMRYDADGDPIGVFPSDQEIREEIWLSDEAGRVPYAYSETIANWWKWIEENVSDPNQKELHKKYLSMKMQEIIDEYSATGVTEYPLGGYICLLYTSPSPRDLSTSRMPSSA